MSPLSGCNSGFAYPSVNVIVLPPASVTAESASESGVPVAPELAPVIVAVVLNAIYPPVLVQPVP